MFSSVELRLLNLIVLALVGDATLSFMLALANKGWRKACEDDQHLLNGLNAHAGHLTYYAVGRALGIDVLAPSLALKK